MIISILGQKVGFSSQCQVLFPEVKSSKEEFHNLLKKVCTNSVMRSGACESDIKQNKEILKIETTFPVVTLEHMFCQHMNKNINRKQDMKK